jgi:regulator-associated protein of mTOR
VNLYRNYDVSGNAVLVSAWKAATDLFPEKKGSFITEWNQTHGNLYTTGSKPIIKAWDADEELCVQVF